MCSGPKRVVVTGGAGFIGSHLVDRLLDQGCPEVIVLDNFSHGTPGNLSQHSANAGLRIVEGDIGDRQVLEDVLRGATIVYHLAAAAVAPATPEKLDASFASNAAGTYNVLRAASRAGVSSLVFASSTEVYGDVIDLPVREDQPLLAITPLGASKIVGEAYCRIFRRVSGLNAAVLRLASVYGPRDVFQLSATWLNQARAGQTLEVSSAREVMDFVYVDQVVEALLRAAARRALPAINVGSGTGTRLIDLARRIIRLTGGGSRVNQPVDATAPRRFVADVERMRLLLGIAPPADPLYALVHLVRDGQLSRQPVGMTAAD